MKKYLIAAAAPIALFAAAAPASAQGFRAEIHGGWDQVSATNNEDNGIVYGIGLGYDIAISDKALIGLDLSADLSSLEECEAGVIKARRDLAAAVRLGYKVSDNGTLYALAGYSNARFRFDYKTAANVTTSTSGNLDGFRIGAGYQHGFGNGAYGKVEYRYSNYEADVSRHQVLVGVGIGF
jgi:outer membrane immunogenic protein